MAKYVKGQKFSHCIKLTSVEGVSIEAVGDLPSNWDDFQGLHKPVKKWIKENCSGKFSMFLIDDGWHTDPIYIGFKYYFEIKSDIVAFKIRWVM